MSTVTRDYSQQGEQEMILEWAEQQASSGSFVDLGAYDGEQYSNTAALAERGWSGICVEAAPDAAEYCARRYADCPDVAVIQAAFVTDGSATVTIHWVPGTMYSSLTGSKRHDVVLVPTEVATLDLGWFADQIAQLPGPLFCSIDLEGASLDALAWLLDNAHPDCVCVEANNPLEQKTVREWLADDWVELRLPNYVNLLFARRDEAA